jgi:hypothetical protein
LTTPQEDQAVIIRATLPSIDADDVLDQLITLENELAEVIALARVGEFDGNEIGQDELKLYMYGPDAEKLFSTVESVLRRASLTRSAIATVRHGPPGSYSRDVLLNNPNS